MLMDLELAGLAELAVMVVKVVGDQRAVVVVVVADLVDVDADVDEAEDGIVVDCNKMAVVDCLRSSPLDNKETADSS